MNPETWTEVDRHYTERLHEDDPVLTRVLENGAANGLPEIQVSAAQGKLLHLLARFGGARRILELGTLGGYSTIWLARALPGDGRIVTLESEPGHAEVARANFALAGVEPLVELIEGPALETLPELEGPFDLIFLDADKESYADYLPGMLRLSRPGTLLIADNVVRGGAVLDDGSEDTKVRGVQRFASLLAADPRIDATAIQTVGAKGYDGFIAGIVSP